MTQYDLKIKDKDVYLISKRTILKIIDRERASHIRFDIRLQLTDKYTWVKTAGAFFHVIGTPMVTIKISAGDSSGEKITMRYSSVACQRMTKKDWMDEFL